MTQISLKQTCHVHSRLSSGWGRWVLQGVLTLTAAKRLLGTANGAGQNGGCTRYCGHRASATRLAPLHQPLPHHLDWRYRPVSDIRCREVDTPKRPVDSEP